MATMTAPTTREEKSRQMGKQGYAISQNVYCPGLFSVTPPKGPRGPIAPYSVDLNARTCNCPDFTGPRHCGPCKHILFVELCRRFWMTLYRVPVVIQTRRHFSSKHLAAFRALAPTMAAHTGRTAPAPVEAAETRRARIAAMIAQDF